MESTRFAIVGGGMTGLAFADAVRDHDCHLFEAEATLGGYCRTHHEAGFTWDYSGHFFHFRHPEIEAELTRRMAPEEVLRVHKEARILYKGRLIDFPFQKNIHQLERDELLDCLYDLTFRDNRSESGSDAGSDASKAQAATSFKAMLYAKFGTSIAEKFLVPYNSKLYATDLDSLDPEAMGRFFPYAEPREIIGNFRRADNRSYNSTFTYPRGGAEQYVRAMAKHLDPSRIHLQERVTAIDLEARVLTTPQRRMHYEHLISSVPFPKLLQMTGLQHDPNTFSANQVLVFNLGFDGKGLQGVHWLYIPSEEIVFYRVGFYDNIFGAERMSLYVEIGLPDDADLTPGRIAELQTRVLADLERCGLVSDQKLIAAHHVVLNPAYVHITQASETAVKQLKSVLSLANVHTLGRYGAWTYCSIEDNVLEARELAARFHALHGTQFESWHTQEPVRSLR